MRAARLSGFLCRVGVLALLHPSPAAGADKTADPATLQSQLGGLVPGDTLHLNAGTYDHFVIDGRNGSPTEWITITGPDAGPPAVIQADPGPCCNTVEIVDSSYVVLRNLTIDGRGVDGAFGVSAKGGTGNLVHHVTVEGCTFLRHDAGQQTVAISTKTPTWGWVIRRNRIAGAGTGLYLGNSDGTSPFIGGLIEHNLVQDTIGYNMEIKWQQPRPDVPGMPTAPTTTVIRHNVFIKTDRPSPSGDRPNLLVGGFPDSGPGSNDRYEIYGNLFFHNPRESLLQASGRVSIHDNIFVDVTGTAIRLQNHDLPLKLATVYNNTIFGAGVGVGFGSTATQGDAVVGNLIFADTPITGPIANSSDNMTDAVANAGSYVVSPSLLLGAMDFYPLSGRCQGSALPLAQFAGDTDYDKDFNGTSKGGWIFRGAYAGEGENPGWQLAAEVKELGSVDPGDGGTTWDGADGVDAGVDAGTDTNLGGDDGAGDDGSYPGGEDAGGGSETDVSDSGSTDDKAGVIGGCGCHLDVNFGGMAVLLALGALLAIAVRRGTKRRKV
ncbi:MAG: hypothetical protein GYA21_17905 [Myxococcales bacterium]|nr:hypothetical protein [Myxococcales bacterium]